MSLKQSFIHLETKFFLKSRYLTERQPDILSPLINLFLSRSSICRRYNVHKWSLWCISKTKPKNQFVSHTRPNSAKFYRVSLKTSLPCFSWIEYRAAVTRDFLLLNAKIALYIYDQVLSFCCSVFCSNYNLWHVLYFERIHIERVFFFQTGWDALSDSSLIQPW